MYTNINCQFECAVKQAARFCGCVPWDFPDPGTEFGENHPVCDMMGNFCFDSSLDNTTLSDCDCLPDCEIVKYSHSLTAEKVDKEAKCLELINHHNKNDETVNNY
mgnify:CR=1 FL=1